MTEEEAVDTARDRVNLDAVVDVSVNHVLEVREESDGWWVCWSPPEDWLGGGPNVFVSKVDGVVREVYYSQ